MNNILVIAPHADDETLGVGGTIKKMSNLGKKVYVLILTNAFIGDSSLFTEEGIIRVRKEAIDAHKLLGVQDTFFSDFPAPRLDTYPIYQIANFILDKINKYKIDTIFIPHRGDIHLDHRRVFEAALVASRPQGNYFVKRILSYETLSETEWAAPYAEDNFIPNVFIDISNELKVKLDAFNCFKSQIKESPHPRSIKGIKNLAHFRGSIVSIDSAESFYLIREII